MIGEVFLLCLPFIIAMTLPMAVPGRDALHLQPPGGGQRDHRDAGQRGQRAANAATGPAGRGMLPAVNFWFTDQILPDSNAKLRNLLINIQRKKPTLEMREQVINEIPPSGLFLRAQSHRSQHRPSAQCDDLRHGSHRRAPHHLRGQRSDGVFVRCHGSHPAAAFDGSIHAFKATERNLYVQVTDFAVNNILVKDVSNRLDLESSDGVRGDREMSTCEMMDIVWEADYADPIDRSAPRHGAAKGPCALLGLEPPPPLALSARAPAKRLLSRVPASGGGWLKSENGWGGFVCTGCGTGRQHGAQARSDRLPVTLARSSFPAASSTRLPLSVVPCRSRSGKSPQPWTKAGPRSSGRPV